METPPRTPPSSPREKKCPNAPRPKDKKIKKNDEDDNCGCTKNFICPKCKLDFQ